jgi:hypothetical protein
MIYPDPKELKQNYLISSTGSHETPRQLTMKSEKATIFGIDNLQLALGKKSKNI